MKLNSIVLGMLASTVAGYNFSLWGDMSDDDARSIVRSFDDNCKNPGEYVISHVGVGEGAKKLLEMHGHHNSSVSQVDKRALITCNGDTFPYISAGSLEDNKVSACAGLATAVNVGTTDVVLLIDYVVCKLAGSDNYQRKCSTIIEATIKPGSAFTSTAASIWCTGKIDEINNNCKKGGSSQGSGNHVEAGSVLSVTDTPTTNAGCDSVGNDASYCRVITA